MELKEEPEFFIAGKLRGIPLVTEQTAQSSQSNMRVDINHDHHATSVRPKREPSLSQQQESKSNSSKISGRQITVSVNGKPIGGDNKEMSPATIRQQQTLRDLVMKDLEKRQVDQPVSLLFMPSASTNSVRNRKSGSATTVMTTTKKPKVLQTTTRKMNPNQQKQQIPPRSQTTTTKSPPTTTKAPTTTINPTTTNSSTTSTSTTVSSTAKKPTATSSLNSGLRDDRLASIFSQKDEHVGPLTTRQAPDYQQRTHQSLGANQRNHMKGLREEPSAGKNWIIFNRQDGSFSAFELAVLVSNVAIVGTIIFVILFTWIKAFNSKYIASFHNELSWCRSANTIDRY